MIRLESVSLDLPLLGRKAKDSGGCRSFEQTVGGVLNIDTYGKNSVRALENISLTLDSGDRLGLIGHNGAGKTTLLRVLAGIYPPTKGQVFISGRVVPIFNLKFGMNIEETGYENIWLRGLFLGMRRSEIKSKISSIAHISGLGRFLDLPIHTYSSGMLARLAFSISIHVEADILLLDEVIGTGDANFFLTAKKRLEEFTKKSKILVLASHSTKVLSDICNKGSVIKKGEFQYIGPIDEAVCFYKSNLEYKKM
jgi:ABC-type polysaccharide/polyol phosphate transport system ATPase subunit